MTSTQYINQQQDKPQRALPGHVGHLRSEFALLVVLAIIAVAVLVAVGVGVALASPTGVSDSKTPDGRAESSTGEASSTTTTDGTFDPDATSIFNPLESTPGIADGQSAIPTSVPPAQVSTPTAPPTTTPPTTTPPTTAAPPTTPAPVATPGAPGLPPDSYWDAMARCETGGNWQMTGPRFSGGVGFANTTWKAYGGLEFAPNAGAATRNQQIVVANRVATQGYGAVRAVGYSAWGCTSHVGYP